MAIITWSQEVPVTSNIYQYSTTIQTAPDKIVMSMWDIASALVLMCAAVIIVVCAYALIRKAWNDIPKKAREASGALVVAVVFMLVLVCTGFYIAASGINMFMK